MAQYLTNLQELEEVLSTPGKVVLDFGAVWCGPCRAIAPTFDKLSLEFPECSFYKINIDDAPDVTTKFDISSVPTFLFLNNGVVQPSLTLSGANQTILKLNLNNLLKMSDESSDLVEEITEELIVSRAEYYDTPEEDSESDPLEVDGSEDL